jgi:hypothetical protein
MEFLVYAQERPIWTATSTMAIVFVWEHIGRLSNWTYRPSVFLEKVRDLSAAAWFHFGTLIAKIAHKIHFARALFKFVSELARKLWFWLSNLSVKLNKIVRAILTLLNKVFKPSEIFKTFGSILKPVFSILLTPIQFFNSLYEYAMSLVDPESKSKYGYAILFIMIKVLAVLPTCLLGYYFYFC